MSLLVTWMCQEGFWDAQWPCSPSSQPGSNHNTLCASVFMCCLLAGNMVLQEGSENLGPNTFFLAHVPLTAIPDWRTVAVCATMG